MQSFTSKRLGELISHFFSKNYLRECPRLFGVKLTQSTDAAAPATKLMIPLPHKKGMWNESDESCHQGKTLKRNSNRESFHYCCASFVIRTRPKNKNKTKNPHTLQEQQGGNKTLPQIILMGSLTDPPNQ